MEGMMPDDPTTLLASIPPLGKGSHGSIERGACIMEAASYIAGEPWSDEPECVCPVIGEFLRAWNDDLPGDERDALLRPLIVRVVNTRATPDVEQRRALMALDWLVREHAPAWLRLAKLTAHADALADLPEIADAAQVPSICGAIDAARRDAASVSAAAWDAARAAAWDAAWNATKSAAWGAARNVASDVSWGAADEAFSAAADAAWGAAEAALGAAEAALGAAGASSVVASDGLNPTRLALQQSALRLVERMINASTEARDEQG